MSERRFLAVVVAAFAALAPTAAHAQWLTYGRDYSHSGRTDETLQAPLAILWEFASRPYYGLAPNAPPTVNAGSPIVLGDTIYFASRDRLYAIDRASGEMKWRYPSGTEPAASIRSTPVYSDGVLYVGANDGNLYAVDANTGSQIWIFRTTGSIRSHPVVIKSSASDPGLVIFGSDDDTLYAIHAKTGDVAWKNTDARADIASALLYDDASGFVYYVASDMQLHGVRASDGKQKWANRTPVSPLNVSPVIYEQRLYMPAGNSVYAFRLNTGARTVTAFLGQGNEIEADISTTPIITADPEGTSQGLIYFGDRNGNFYCGTLKGQRRWKQRLDARASAMPVLAGKTRDVGTEKGFVYGLNAADGSILWSCRSEAPRDYQARFRFHNISAPLVADRGQLLVLGDDGTLTCFTADAVDATPPTIVGPRPDRSANINGSPPVTVSAYLWDVGSGINPATVAVYLDSEPMAPSDEPYYRRGSSTKTGVVYDPIDKRVEYSTPAGATGQRAEPLREGRHTVKIEAADWKGNASSLEWSFTVDNRLPVRKRPTTPGATPGSAGYGRYNSGGGNSGGFPGGPGVPGGYNPQRTNPSRPPTRGPASRRRTP
jgi:outer membrane protein assembly factor BamB